MTSGAEAHRRLVLDTSAYSRMRSGHELVLDMVANAEAVIVPVTVLGELGAGFALGNRERENRTILAEFLSETFVTIQVTSREIASRYGVLFAALKRDGTPVPVNDIWIAAATLACGGHLLTFDRHFGRIPSLPRTILDR